MEQEFTMRDATAADIPAITALILTHGPNPWNHLPEGEIREHVAQIATGKVEALVAELRQQIIGAVTYQTGSFYPQYQPPEERDDLHGYLKEAVVHREHAGHGIGSRLFRVAAERLFARGIRQVYARRHEENPGSAGMMRKSGFHIVDTFDDPEIRLTGSRRTTVERLTADEVAHG